MEIGLREWLIVIGIVVIAGILFDGWRRMRGSKGKLKFKLDRSFADLPDDEGGPEVLGPARVVDRSIEPSMGDDPGFEPMEPVRAPSRSNKTARSAAVEPQQTSLELLDDPLIDVEADVAEEPQPSAARSEREPVEEVLVINVLSRDTDGFRGPALLQNILESGLRFGEMDIFHRHESMTGHGEVLFSMANAVKPGTFDLDDIDHFTTPAVSFFLGLPGPRHPKQAFDLMIAAARKLSQELNGELKDDQRSVLTAQTIEHYRQRIVEFERRQMTLKR